jgi:hypothetical protein
MSTSSPMALIDIFVAPKTVFENLQANKKWAVVGLLITMGIVAVSSLMFFGGMSPDWIVEQQMMAAGDMTASEREAMKEAAVMTAEYIGIMAAVGSLIMIPIMAAIFALYYKIIGSTVAEVAPEYKFGDWFTFSVWTLMPTVINTLGFMALFLTAATADLPISMPNYASVNQLFMNLLPGDALYNWAENLNLFAIWSIVIAAIGFNRCCKMSMVKSVIFAAIPTLVIFGVWFIIA